MDLINSLRRMEFPENCERALIEIAAVCMDQRGGVIPGLGQDNFGLASDIADEFIFYRTSRSRKKLSAVEELQVLELTMQFFSSTKNPPALYTIVFNTLFGGKLTDTKLAFLNKLMSMSLGLKNKIIVDCAAQWIQDQGHSSPGPCMLVRTIVEDYCLLLPGAKSVLTQLPELSLHFTCNFIATLTVIYMPFDTGDKSRPVLPHQLLKLVTTWISNSHSICLVSLQYPTRSQSHSSTLWAKPVIQTPILGLVSWCVLAPLMCELNTKQNFLPVNGNSDSIAKLSPDHYTKQLTLYSQLFLGLLHTLLAFQSSGFSMKLMNPQDLVAVAESVHELISRLKSRGDVVCVNTAVDRLAQFLQTALSVRAIKCHKEDINRIFQYLPDNKLLSIIRMFHS